MFVSDEKAGGRDRFEFADGHMTSGTFVRADGKAFPVRRISGRSE